jgi:MFS family permease
VPFLFSIVLVVVGLFIRLRIAESPLFVAMKAAGGEARTPLVEAVRTQWKSILLVIGMRVCENACGYIISVFALSYATTQLGLPRSVVLPGLMLAALVQFVITPVYGALSDRIGRRPVYIWGAGFLAVIAFPFFWLIETRVPALVWLALVLGYAVGNGALFATQPAFFSELFGTRVRYSGISLGYQISAVFAGGLAPFIATLLLARAGGRPWPVALYILVVALISLVTAIIATETLRGTLEDGAVAEVGGIRTDSAGLAASPRR